MSWRVSGTLRAMDKPWWLRGIRGATTVAEDTAESILEATRELLLELLADVARLVERQRRTPARFGVLRSWRITDDALMPTGAAVKHSP